ncbi:MAG: SGNH/GDSL hydrolase family protein [Clostridiales bacterium]|nr:SGNH/GDSL hydrolase family protein [Clostridiales bacterium]
MRRVKSIFSVVVIIVLAFITFALLYIKGVEAKNFAQWANERNDILSSKLAASKENDYEEKELGFYEKLAEGEDVNILIVGDTIGTGYGSTDSSRTFSGRLKSYLSDEYESLVTVTNVSMKDNTSYAGYVRTMSIRGNLDYDLAIICFGEKDNADDFSLYYESVIRAIIRKSPNCSMISMLQSTQMNYNEKTQIIEDLSLYYDIPVADTISIFNESEEMYLSLTDSGVFPNDSGYKMYFEKLRNIIDINVEEQTPIPSYKEDPVNKDVLNFTKFKYFSRTEFERLDNLTYIIKTDSLTGIMGIDYGYQLGDNIVRIYADEQLITTMEFSTDSGFTQRHILVASDNCEVQNEIKVVFETKQQADVFNGIAFSSAY